MRKYTHLLVVIGMAFLMFTAGPSSAITIEITESVGAQQGDSDQGPWSPLTAGTQLSTCKYIRLPGNFSRVQWQRVGACGNKGIAETGLSKVKVLHVGTDIMASQTAMAGSLTFGAIDLVAAAGVDGSDATIIEEQNCVGTDHCGFNSAIAQAAPMVSTPPGEYTRFSGSLEDGQVRFVNHLSSPISIATSPLLGANAGQIFMIAPGQCITYYPDGSHVIRNDCIPTVSEWGMVLVLLVMLSAGTIVFGFRQAEVAGVGAALRRPTFVASVFTWVLAITMTGTVAALAGIITLFGPLSSVDIAGSLASAIVLAYLIHLWVLLRRS